MVQALQKSLWVQILGGQASGLQLERKLPETGAPPQPWDPCPQVSRRCQTASRTARIAAGPAPAPRSYSAGAGQPGWPRWECRRRARGACCWASAWSGGCRGTVSSLRREVSTSEWVGAEQTSPAASFPSNRPEGHKASEHFRLGCCWIQVELLNFWLRLRLW